METGSARYAVITPAKNEDRFIGQTIASMISQKTLPVVWVIVDDLSTDATAQIVKECAENHSWVRYLLHPGEAVRKTGSAEIHAFDYGYKTISDLSFDFIVKLDADLRFDEEYFEGLLLRFSAEHKLGIASGIYLEEALHSWEPVTMPVYHAAGASKVVRRECFEQIGGFIAQRGWDTVDEIRAQAKGWETRHFPELKFYHLRKEGTGMGQLHTNLMHGEIFYRTGGSFFFFLLKSINRMMHGQPFFFAGAAMIYGYVLAFLKRKKLLVNAIEARAYRRLLYGRLRSGLRRMLPI